jgi:hypothetical protein
MMGMNFRENPMSILIADETLPAKLEAIRGPVEVWTKDGRQLGVFTPKSTIPSELEPAISEEEILRRLNDRSGKWYTAAEVEAKMKEWRCSK